MSVFIHTANSIGRPSQGLIVDDDGRGWLGPVIGRNLSNDEVHRQRDLLEAAVHDHGLSPDVTEGWTEVRG